MLDPQEERTKFISLREALFLIAKAKRVTPQKAAETLQLSLNRADGWHDLKLMRYLPAYGMVHIDDEDANELATLEYRLSRLANDNVFLHEIDDDIPF